MAKPSLAMTISEFRQRFFATIHVLVGPSSRLLYHNATGLAPGLMVGTSPERIAAESVTRALFEFVHGHMSRHLSFAPQNAVARCWRLW
jgi:hypothetical protein